MHTGAFYHRVTDIPAATVTSISAAEKAAAVAIRAAFRGYVIGGKRQFKIDKQTLATAFTAQSLDIADYGIMDEISNTVHSGFQDDDIALNEPGITAETYSAIDYQALFSFVLAAGPDLSALEARVTALENA